MKFYRPLSPIRAISFDLDDTLYDNGPVIVAAEQAMLDFLHQHYPACAELTLADWFALRQRAIEQEPRLDHHVSKSRLAALEAGLVASGYPAEEARQGARAAFEALMDARNDVPVPQETLEVLEALARQVPLVALTNGNADIERIGLGQFFRFAILAEQVWANKPKRAMFEAASQRLALAPGEILHVGDHLRSDVFGALRSGYQACWLNAEADPLRHHRRAQLLPHVEIHELGSLLRLPGLKSHHNG